MENDRFGQFQKIHSYGCFLDKKLVGICLFLIRQGQGYISEILIDTELQGRHLGKSLLFNMVKRWFEQNDESQQIDLDVTLENESAYYLYKSFGFQEEEYYSIYCWVNPNFQHQVN
jgi:ribosomal protein S18 acetylase RimI-like enzyme